jgi:hypothetical protein
MAAALGSRIFMGGGSTRRFFAFGLAAAGAVPLASRLRFSSANAVEPALRAAPIAPVVPKTSALHPAAPPDGTREPWASKGHPQDVAKRHVEDVTAALHEYAVTQGGTMDGSNCRSPVGGAFAIWEQSWESNRAVRLENVGTTDVINPWLSNGRNDFRSVPEIVAQAVRPGMTDREKVIALWRLQTTHRFHADSGDKEVNDPVKVLNVYGYTTCGNDSICLAGLWRAAGLKVRPARVAGHCISQAYFDGRWNLLDGDLGPFYLLRDNATIAGEKDLVRDHDLVKRSHTRGLLDPDSRAEDEFTAAVFLSETNWPGTRDSVRNTTMNLTLRPGEAIVWRWGHLTPVKYHGATDLKEVAADRVCNGNWEYRPDFTRDLWRKGAEKVKHVTAERGELVPETGKTGVIVWKLRSPYPFVGGKLDADETGVKFSLSWDGTKWHDLDDGLEPLFFHFPHKGDARYEYRLRCKLPAGSRLRRIAISNDLEMTPLALPGMVVGENRFTYTDETRGLRQVRLTHEWVERSLSLPPRAPAAPVFPADGGRTDGTDIVFAWRPAEDPDGDAIADYHFQLADRRDMAWPLSSNFEKLISNTADRGRPRYRLPYLGLLTPGQTYYWRVRAKDAQGVWGPWGATWSFTAGGPAPPTDVRLEPLPDDSTRVALRWKPGTLGEKPVKFRIYGSDEKGFTVSDEAYAVNVGASELPRKFAANFTAETAGAELIVLGPGLDVPNANKAFYRVVAVDAAGKRSGPSDYAAAARPFIYTRPPDRATVGAAYRGLLATIGSLGDLRSYQLGQESESRFWEVETPRFVLVSGPAWLRLDEKTGALTGMPDTEGAADVVVKVTLERTVRKLDDSQLSWGHELVKKVGTDVVGSVTHRFRITVGPTARNGNRNAPHPHDDPAAVRRRQAAADRENGIHSV